MTHMLSLSQYRENILSMVNLLAAAEASFAEGPARQAAYSEVAKLFGIDHDTFSMIA